LKITDGDLDVKSGENNRINIAGNWINNDLFTARSGEVVFDGGDQTLLGSTVFYKFAKSETSDNSTDTVLTFEAGQTQTILGQWAVNGLDSDDRIQLRSTNPGAAPGSDWDVDPEGTRVLSYLEVQNSNNVSGVTVDCTNNCMDDGDNTDWNFTSVPITITGTVYIDQGVTDIGAGITVAVSINGGAIDATDTTDANGGYSITTVSSVGATSILTLFINDETENAVTVTNATGTDMAGIDLYQDYLIVRNDNLVALTNANLDTANNVADGDVDAIYTVPSANNVRTTNGTELLVPLGHTYEPGGNVEVGVTGLTSMLDIAGTMTMNASGFLEVEGTMDVSGTFIGDGGYLDINGDLTVSSGSLTSTTGSLMVAGTVSLAPGSFSHNSGALVLDGTGQQTVSAASATFNSITVTNASGAGVIFDEAFTVQNFTNTTPNS
ncbi:MAG: hypothetical protein K8I00_03930, partial [Candidatus Omnitrophica bacterium]|nr:hypothetical protein [Candidatus Omnitrophota bacterium]